MFRSATFKLTMWYLALVMAISVAFSVVLYHVATAELARGLRHETQRIFNQFPVFNNSPMLQPGKDLTSGEHSILLRLVGFNLIVFVGAGFASYWLARRTLQPIEEAHEQQKRFTADVSHELRTPLTALKMESEVALMNPQASKQELRQTLGSNLEEVAKLEALINNLLRLTRLEADELQQNFTPQTTVDISRAAVKQVTKAADAHKISIKNDTGNLALFGDHDGLVQLVVILLDNAIKYSLSGSTVTISSQQVDNRVLLEVADHGVGIEREALEHVFDRFYRADNSRNKGGAVEGYGLGLSIAKMIAELHHGTITLSSKPGEGTTATVSLPGAPQGNSEPTANISDSTDTTSKE